MNNEYLSERDKGNKRAFETIAKKYNNLESMVKSIDYDVSKIDKWFNKEISTSYNDFSKLLKKEKRHIYITTILSILSVAYFILSILYFNKNFLFLFILSLILLIIDFTFIKKHKIKKYYQLIHTKNWKSYSINMVKNA